MKTRYILLITLLAILNLAGCSAPPSEKTIRDTIIKYFSERQYTVKDIAIGRVEGLALRNKRYMGKEGYTIEIKSITLESRKDVPAFNYRKGQFIIFSNAVIQIREKTNQRGTWEISDISGIPVI